MPLAHVSGFIEEEDFEEILEWLETAEDVPESLVELIEHLAMWRTPA